MSRLEEPEESDTPKVISNVTRRYRDSRMVRTGLDFTDVRVSPFDPRSNRNDKSRYSEFLDPIKQLK